MEEFRDWRRSVPEDLDSTVLEGEYGCEALEAYLTAVVWVSAAAE